MKRLILVILTALSANVYAQEAGVENTLASFLPIVILFAVFYFLIIRPQSKKMKLHRQMVESIKKGDSVVAAGGIGGVIQDIDPSFVSLLVAKQTLICVQKQSIISVLPHDTFDFEAVSAPKNPPKPKKEKIALEEEKPKISDNSDQTNKS